MCVLEISELKPEDKKMLWWSDGPGQFRSGRFLAFSVVAFDKFAQLMEVSANCGFPAHFKGKHDGFFGIHKHVFDEHVSALPDGVLVETFPRRSTYTRLGQRAHLRSTG